MKKIISILILISCLSNNSISQLDSAKRAEFDLYKLKQDTPVVQKKFKVGFSLGINRSILKLEQSDPKITTRDRTGIQIGIFGDYELTNLITLFPKIDLSINRSEILYPLVDSATRQNYHLMPFTLDCSLSTRFISKKRDYKPFISVGPRIKFLIAQDYNYNGDPRASKYNFLIDISIGFLKKNNRFALSPELKYSHGLNDINRNPNFEKALMHTLALILNLN